MPTKELMYVEQAGTVVETINPNGINITARPILLICEHASNFIPPEFNDLGLDADTLKSHIAWDIGAYQLAKNMSKILNATFIFPKTSRLIYDCNRAPSEPSAIPAKSEVFEITSNRNLNNAEREERTALFYQPFHELLSKTISTAMNNGTAPIIITIHTFTPKYLGEHRAVEIGIIHDKDSRFADGLLNVLASEGEYNVRRNEPYGAEDAVTHTLKEHAIKNDLLNVMIEVRNDLVTHDPHIMAAFLSKNIQTAIKNVSLEKGRNHVK